MIFKKYKLSELCTIKYGKDHKVHNDGEIPVYGTGGIMRHIDDYIYDQESVLIPRKGTLTGIFYVENKFWTVDTLFWTIINKNNVVPKYLYYYLLTIDFNNMNVGSAVPSLTTKLLNEIEIFLPNINEQSKILNILSSIDSKIELNNKINNNLEELAQTLYKHWFVDFEFPNEEGLPYKSSGGKMIESELGNIPEGWIIYNQGDFSPVITGKKNANIATSNGDYKFFTCGQEPLLTDDFSFDAEAILVAGNGDFNVKYYRGKFEAYQRTYVLIPHISKLTPLLYFSIKNNLNEITKGHRGSVIKFITKGDLENFKLALPIKEKLLALSSVFTTILNKITTIKEENEKLANIRDLLLPKLMSDEIRVPVEE